MQVLVQATLLNALLVVPLALLAAAVSRLVCRPALAHALWLLVLLKLLTPPLLTLPVTWPGDTAAAVAALPSEPHEAPRLVEDSPEEPVLPELDAPVEAVAASGAPMPPA